MELADIALDRLAKNIQDLQVQAALGGEIDETTIDVGSIVYLEWGWNCTIVEFYVVVRRTARTVVLRQLAMRGFPEWRDFPDENDVLPVAEWAVDSSEQATVRAWLVSAEGEPVMVKAGSKYGWLWSGRPIKYRPYSD